MKSLKNDFSVTQRAYTLRLNAAAQKDGSWTEKLWKTHEIVNRGSAAFGDWLLTLRGGLSHELADVQGDKSRDRRILLALSWLSVESKVGAPKEYIVEKDKNGRQKTREALRAILNSRGVRDEEVKSWLKDCETSLTAAIRNDAVWVNRSMAFDEKAREINESLNREGDPLSREEVWDILRRFFGSEDAYFEPVDVSKDGIRKEDEKNLVEEAGGWLSNRFGRGKGADFEKLAGIYSEIAEWAGAAREGKRKNNLADLAAYLENFAPASNDREGILHLLFHPGRDHGTQIFLKALEEGAINEEKLDTLKKKAEVDAAERRKKIGRKGRKEWADKVLESIEKSLGSKFTYNQKNGSAKHQEFVVMLDHAARKISTSHTWIKRAEAERRTFEKDLQKKVEVPENARQWLDDYCRGRSEASGAIEGYRIRKGAVTGWEEVLRAWEDSETEEERFAIARDQQDNPEIDKFGDIQLFEALAAKDAICVWKVDEKTDANILDNYVAASEAEFNKRRFKVPAYRHPHPLLHPVFVDYGKSRWGITFDIHKIYKKSNSAKASSGVIDAHGLRMDIWNGCEIEEIPLRWQSKLLEKDLDIKQEDERKKESTVIRASRLGRAVAGANWKTPVSISSVFEEKNWNARLQVSRNELDRIARQLEKNKENEDERIISMSRELKWFVTFSPRFMPQGPWPDYVANSCDKSPFENAKGKTSLNGAYFEVNENRGWLAKFMFPRLPGLRVLSLDLGHRHAAACAVWETLSSKQMEDACAKEDYEKPSPEAMYHHIKTDRKVVYRRIGSDKLPEGSSHPASWARLERQFLIKLQGEEGPARMATADEIWQVHELERTFGMRTPLIDRLVERDWGRDSRALRQLLEDFKRRGWSAVETEDRSGKEIGTRRQSLLVDELMFSAVKTLRDALRRHGERAKMAYFLVTEEKIEPGGRVVKLDEEGRKEIIADALLLWKKLATERKWKDPQALALWKTHIEPALPAGELPDITESEAASKEMKGRKKELKEKLIPVAERLFSSCAPLSAKWHERWKQDDEKWKKHLRWLRDWILPRGAKKENKSIRKVGGLSLNRLATIQGLYRAHKAYFARIKPDGPQMEDGRPVTAGKNFGRRMLDDLEKMREQRAKQLSSRIVEAALGIGRIKTPRKGRAPRRPIERVDAPCHIVVIENLTRYKPEAMRTRFENRQLMSWSYGKVREYLLESCNLHGLLLWEVSPQYTSRQDSRTGAPGLRCEDVSVKTFHETSFWQKELARADKEVEKRKAGAYENYLLKLKKKWENSGNDAALLRIPNKSGDIFVSADRDSSTSRGLQADLNAAANIGLKAIMDPDWPGRWWYVPCNSRDFKPLEERVKGSKAFEGIRALRVDSENLNASDKKKNAKERIVNLWRDSSCRSLEVGWKRYAEYWEEVENRVTDIIKKLSQQLVW